MTHEQQDAYGDAPAQARGIPIRNVANGAGAILSVALVFGMGFWGYKLAVRDVSGVPVVRALEGPMRVAPDDPGGKQAEYQGLAVNAVAAEGVAAPLPERVVLAPPPVELDFSDAELITPGANDAEAAGNAGAEAGLWTNAAMRAVIDTAEPAQAPGADGGVQDEEGAQDETAPQEDTQPAVSPDAPGVARSPIPQVRPEHDMVANAAARAASRAVSPEADVEIDPDSLSPGTRLVQLGAFDDRESAREEWDRLDRRFGALLEDKGRVIQPAESGGRTFYRLRAVGFDAEAEARRFCAVLLAEQAACIPVLIR